MAMTRLYLGQDMAQLEAFCGCVVIGVRHDAVGRSEVGLALQSARNLLNSNKASSTARVTHILH
jgi:hypothetical protein